MAQKKAILIILILASLLLVLTPLPVDEVIAGVITGLYAIWGK